MNIQNLTLEQLIELRGNLVREGKDSSEISFLIDCKESEYLFSLFEDVSGTGGPAGSAGAATIGIGGGGVAYGNAAFGGMGAVVSAQPSNNTGVTTEPGYTAGGGKTGSGDVSVPYNTGGTKMFQKIPVDNRKGSNKRRKNKMLAQLKGALLNRQDFTKGQGDSKPKKLMNFDSFSKDDLNKIKKVNQ
jgi:hypothetical protein